MKLIYNVQEISYNNYHINDILQKELKISNRLLAFLLKNNLIFCNDVVCDGISCDTRNLAQIGDIITVSLDYSEDNSNIIATNMPLDIIYEDDWMLILNKPSGIAIHPSLLHYNDSISNGVRYYFDKIELQKKIRPVNRLDFHTSGLVVFAKCAYIHEHLSLQMQNNTFSKNYLALVHGKLPHLNGTIDLPISRKQGSIIERCINFDNGQKAITNYEVIRYIEDTDCTLIKCHLITGRTHQIRVHFSSIGHPLVGDSLYGNDNGGQYLHCYCLTFIHPVTKQCLKFIKKDVTF